MELRYEVVCDCSKVPRVDFHQDFLKLGKSAASSMVRIAEHRKRLHYGPLSQAVWNQLSGWQSCHLKHATRSGSSQLPELLGCTQCYKWIPLWDASFGEKDPHRYFRNFLIKMIDLLCLPSEAHKVFSTC